MECRLGLIQLAAGEDKAENLRVARAEIDRAVRDGAELVILPEMFCLPYETARFAEYAEAAGGPAQQMLAAAAREIAAGLSAARSARKKRPLLQHELRLRS